MSEQGDVYTSIVDQLDWAMVVVTARADDDGELGGCLVGFHSQCSIDPPRHLVCVSKLNHTWSVAQRSSELAVHVLGADQIALARDFGEVTDDEAPGDKWGTVTVDDRFGPPILLDAVAWFAGPVVASLDAGDHVALVVEPTRGSVRDDPITQLGFQATQDFQPGHPAD
jgi:flavin reductase (DIM6/NTAB) family NADH-FMN oxidoreductase RutF